MGLAWPVFLWILWVRTGLSQKGPKCFGKPSDNSLVVTKEEKWFWSQTGRFPILWNCDSPHWETVPAIYVLLLSAIAFTYIARVLFLQTTYRTLFLLKSCFVIQCFFFWPRILNSYALLIRHSDGWCRGMANLALEGGRWLLLWSYQFVQSISISKGLMLDITTLKLLLQIYDG